MPDLQIMESVRQYNIALELGKTYCQFKGNVMRNGSVDKEEAGVTVTYFYGDTVCSGYVAEFSGEDLLIHSDKCFPIFSKFDLYIFFQDELLQLTVQVKEVREGMRGYDTMIVHALCSFDEYRKLLDIIRLSRQS